MPLICCAPPLVHAQDSAGDTVRKLNARSITVEPIESKLEQIKKQKKEANLCQTKTAKSLVKLQRTLNESSISPRFSLTTPIVFFPESVPVLTKLGEALSSDELKAGKFLINGHTDDRGGQG